jgi:23S rRNA pseudouridine2604 synthase
VLKSLQQALFFEGWAVPSARASWQSERRLRLAIKHTRPGQVAHLCERAGLVPTAVHRLRLGRIGLGGLAAGQWRYLMPYERF